MMAMMPMRIANISNSFDFVLLPDGVTEFPDQPHVVSSYCRPKKSIHSVDGLFYTTKISH